MYCQKYEITRPEMAHDGRPDTDAVLTTRELIKLIKYIGIDFENLLKVNLIILWVLLQVLLLSSVLLVALWKLHFVLLTNGSQEKK